MVSGPLTTEAIGVRIFIEQKVDMPKEELDRDISESAEKTDQVKENIQVSWEVSEIDSETSYYHGMDVILSANVLSTDVIATISKGREGVQVDEKNVLVSGELLNLRSETTRRRLNIVAKSGGETVIPQTDEITLKALQEQDADIVKTVNQVNIL